ncbi:hypothetical protein [Rhodoferax sp. GW822-FHT02A01]|uniref:hypothetical protein n=1 Tax=Rhodoferax sp. GW822-FHT02A01 TaxID=3141537 RepID=UPI00315CBB56
MTWWHYLLLFFIGQPLALFIGYAVGIQYESETLPAWLRFVFEVIVCLALIIDFIANMTVLSIYLWELPQIHDRREWTFSTRLERLCLDTTTWQGRTALQVALLLNRIAPPGKPHIKNAGR